MKRYIITLMLVVLFSDVFCQQIKNSGIEMADGLRSSGKIYVVVLVITILMSGLFLYLINLDKRIGKLEKFVNSRGK